MRGDLIEPVSRPFTKETWNDQYVQQYDCNRTMLVGHIDCVQRIVPFLEEMLETSKNAKELKKKLRAFMQQQKEFVVDVGDKSESWEAHKYHLPSDGLRIGYLWQ